MNYQETCDYLYNQMPMFERQGASGYKEGLSNTHALDAHFGHPHRYFQTIHVGGTNGKGSCSHTLAAILQQSGLRVGLYTSPHLVDFRERIRINGTPIGEEYVTRFVKTERSFFEPLHPSFFEVTTAMAFTYFKDMNVDIAVVEVGLGGRLDCTNIITPLVSIITNISYDHTQFLGNTLAKIAGEKAGIIKPDVPVVIGENHDETRPVFEQKAAEVHAPIIFAEDQPEVLQANMTSEGGTVVFLYSTPFALHQMPEQPSCCLRAEFTLPAAESCPSTAASHHFTTHPRRYDACGLADRTDGTLAGGSPTAAGGLRHRPQRRGLAISESSTGQSQLPQDAHCIWNGKRQRH